ncbi:MAG: hypothetical protein ACREBR_03140, partial [bacterium]
MEDSTYWTGGKRVEGKLTEPPSPYCFRPLGFEKSQKIFKYATTPLDKKFEGKEGDDLPLTSFCKRVWIHLVMTGMDSVLYFVDPLDMTERSIIEYYARFTPEFVRQQTINMISNTFDAKNIAWSGQFLFNSISIDQQNALEKYQIEGSNGPLIWMYLIHENRSNSERALETVRRSLEAMKLSDFPGENVKLCCEDISRKCLRLETAHRLPENVASTVCSIFSKCSIEEFRTPFHERRQACDRKKDAFKYKDLVEIATSSYQSMVDADDWLPKSKNSDDVIHGLLTRIATLEMKKKADTRGQDSNVPSNVKCFVCNGNHYATTCPHKNKSKQGNKQNNWKATRPTGNGPTTKIVDGQTWQWCEHCSRWSNSHSTSEHRRKKKREKKS